jgi:hypothetical protein
VGWRRYASAIPSVAWPRRYLREARFKQSRPLPIQVGVKLGATIALYVLVLAILALFAGQFGLGGRLAALGVLAGGVVGARVGWDKSASVSAWVPPVLAGGGILFVLIAFTQYNDDGPSGALFGPLLGIGLLALAATAVAAGVVVGSHLRRARDPADS